MPNITTNHAITDTNNAKTKCLWWNYLEYMITIICLMLKSRQVKPLIVSINKSIIWKMNPSVFATTSIKFKSAFQHV